MHKKAQFGKAEAIFNFVMGGGGGGGGGEGDQVPQLF